MNNRHESKFNDLSNFVAKMMERKKVPGVAVGVLHEGEIHTAGFGVTNVDHPLSVTDETLFQIGSITKTFTGTAMMRLMEMGKLEQLATVRTYLPDFKVADETATSQATIRHLLTHTSGWVGDFFEDTGEGDDALPKYMAKMADLEQLAPIGAVWSYNNSGFNLAGYIIEQVTGKSYEAALKELVLEPLGLEHCYFAPGDVITHRFAVGHDIKDQSAQVVRPWPLPRAAYPAGGITCHVKDLLRYARFHLGDGTAEDGTRLLTLESLSQMYTPQVIIWGKYETMGLTWFINDEDGIRKLSHGGRTNGQASSLTLVPEHHFAIAIFTNANQGGTVTGDVSRYAVEKYVGVKRTGKKKESAPIASPLEELAAYVGRYVRPFAELELGILGGKLVGQATPKGGFPSKDSPPPPTPPPMSLAQCEKDRLLVLDGPSKGARVDAIRKPDGTIGWLRWGNRICKRET